MQRTDGLTRLHTVGTPLSAEDRLVLERVARGWTNPEIGRDLGLSVSQVLRRVGRLQHKLDARNRAHVVAQACRAGLLEPLLVEAGR